MSDRWEWLTLADVLLKQNNGKLVQQGWSPKCHDHPAERGAWGVLKTTSIQAGSFDPIHNKELPERLEPKPQIEVSAGDLLITCAGPRSRCGIPALVRSAPPRLMMSGKMYRLRADGRLDPRFLEYWLLSPRAQKLIDGMKTGISESGLNLTHSRFVRLPVPIPPLDEQRRIVDFLEDHLSRLDAADRQLAHAASKLAAIRARTLIGSLTASGVPDRIDAPPEPAGTADGLLPSLPRGWSWSRLGDVADVVGGITKDSNKQHDPTYVEVPYLRVANVQRGRLLLDDVATIRVSPAKADALRLLPGDVLLNEGGDRDKLARGWVWEGQIEGCIHQNHVFRARLREPRLDPYFLSLTANALGGKWAERNGKQSVNLASISLSVIRKMPVIVPAAGEAVRVVAAVRERQAQYDRLNNAITQARRQIAALRKSLLAAAFAGRLTGGQSPSAKVESLVSP